MSLTNIIQSSLTGLSAAQAGLKTTTDNVANVNTEGYARTRVTQTTARFGGVDVTGVERIVDSFLEKASRDANSEAAKTSVVSDLLDRLQLQFGTTDDENSVFGQLNQAFNSIGGVALEGSGIASIATALADIQAVFDEATRLSNEVNSLITESDDRINSDLQRLNTLLRELDDVNNQMGTTAAAGVDDSTLVNAQSSLLQQISEIMDIRTQSNSDGSIWVKTSSGMPLLDNDVTALSYSSSQGAAGGRVIASNTAGTPIDITVEINSGSLGGLLEVRNNDLPNLALQLAEFVSGAGDALNAAHNNSSSYPAPNALTGQNTGLLGTDQLSGSGTSYIAVVDANGDLVQSVQVDVGAGGFSVNGGAVGPTIDNLVAGLNAAFGANATVSFTNGVMTVDAANAAHGVATVQDETAPSSIGGRGLAHFFGLNNVVSSDKPYFFETGVDPAASAHGLTTGDFEFNVYTPDGKLASSITVNVAGATVQDQLDAINNAGTGIGAFGTYALDSDGQIQFTPQTGYESYRVVLTDDGTSRGTTGQSFSEVFGLGQNAKIARGNDLSVNPDIMSNPAHFATATLAVTGASVAGDEVLASGDRSGAQSLFEAYNATRTFDDAGNINGANMTLKDYAGRLASDTGSRAATAERAALAADALKIAADDARAEIEGVNLDEELANMSLYQQAYNASARLLQAADEMFETLIRLV